MSRIPSEIAPTILDPDLLKLCAAVAPASTPLLVPVIPFEGAVPGECFANVNAYIAQHGGQRKLGWRLMRWANIMVECEAHAVWESSTGVLLDVTPYSQAQSLFLPDPSLTYNGYTIPNHRMALTDSPLVKELIELSNEKDILYSAVPAGQPITIEGDSMQLHARLAQLLLVLKTDVGRNEPCPCQSGLKFKKCCGRFG